MIKSAFVAILALVALSPSGSACASTPNEQYELSERCGKRVEEWFIREWGKTGIVVTNETTTAAEYRNHYNARMNKCFMLLTVQRLPNRSGKGPPFERRVILMDINESKEYGTLVVTKPDAMRPSVISSCSVAAKHCEYEQEWGALIAPYMGE